MLQAETQLKTAQAQSIDLGVQRAQLSHGIALLVGEPASAPSILGRRMAASVSLVKALGGGWDTTALR